MKKQSRLQCQFYSTRPLKKEMRLEFSLPGDPYHKDSVSSRDILRCLGVVFYRDERHPMGIIIEPNPEKPTIESLRGWQAWKHAVVINDFKESNGNNVILVPQPWPKVTDSYLKEKGDDRSWLYFNSEVRIAQMTTEIVQLA